MRFRFRYVALLGGSIAVTAALFATDPDKGSISTWMFLLMMAVPAIAVGFAHVMRKALHDYPEADMRSLFRKAGESPIGAGLALVALSIVVSALLGLFGKVNAHEVHPRAKQYAPVIAQQLDTYWPAVPMRAYIPALISHESCISYTHSRCWSPTSRLKTHREEGAGLGQITRAWRADGSLRFDALAEMRDRHPALRELSWSTIYGRPDLQIRTIVLQSLGNYNALRMVSDPMARLAMVDAAYNGGLQGVLNERRACALTVTCDAQQWFDHVELHCLKSRAVLYGNRSACDINRHHVKDVLKVRITWYKDLL